MAIDISCESQFPEKKPLTYLIPLHDPVVIWRPLVKVFPAQLLMKLFVDVNDFACQTSAAPICVLPSTNEPL